MFEHTQKQTDSLLKFLSDLYSSPNTSSIFYTNDAKVLLDIIIRQLEDLPCGDKVSFDQPNFLSLSGLYQYSSLKCGPRRIPTVPKNSYI